MSSARTLVDRARRKFNNLFNLDLVKVSGQYKLDAHISAVLSAYRVEAIIDVGANEGGFGALMRSLGFRGPIYSFEPVDSAFSVLSSRAKNDGGWHVFNCALGASAGTGKINVSKFSQFSSILPATSYGNSWKNMEVQHTQEIVIRTLDDCLREGALGNANRYFLKMDTQGYDVEVFRGGGQLMPKVCCMLSELSLLPLYQGMPNYLESLAVYREAGFLVSGLYPITRNRALALNEVDCMMVRPEFLASQDERQEAIHG